MKPAWVLEDIRRLDKTCTVAVAMISEGVCRTEVHLGRERADEGTAFELGSVGKTFTSLLLADLHTRGVLRVETTVGEVLGADAGSLASVSLADLATHRSGLPAVAPRFDRGEYDPDDPYADFTSAELIEALADIPLGAPGYSNLGYEVLGHVIGVACRRGLDDLVKERIFDPLGMSAAPNDTRRPALLGFEDGQPVGRWHGALNGPGGWEGSVRDVAAYLSAHLSDEGPLAEAIQFSLHFPTLGPVYEGLGWAGHGSLRVHDGATGGFSTFAGFDRELGQALGILCNTGDLEDLVTIGCRALAG